MSSPFDGIQTTAASRDANYVTPGHYVMRIDDVRLKKNRKEEPIFVIEMTPLHVLASELCKMNGKDTASNKQGVPCTHLIPFTGPGKDMALPNIKAFVLGCQPGTDEADIDEDAMQFIVSDDQPLSGSVVEVVARSIRTKSDKDFTKINYVGPMSLKDRLDRALIDEETYNLLAAEEGGDSE